MVTEMTTHTRRGQFYHAVRGGGAWERQHGMIESLGPSLDILRGLLGNWWGVGISRQGRSVNKDPGCVCGGGGGLLVPSGKANGWRGLP